MGEPVKTKTAEQLDALMKAVRSFERADTELRRATAVHEQPRLANAGSRYQFAKWRLFSTLRGISP